MSQYLHCDPLHCNILYTNQRPRVPEKGSTTRQLKTEMGCREHVTFSIMRLSGISLLVSVVVSYSSNEKATIAPLLTESLKFTNDVVVSFGSHLLDGSLEDRQHMDGLAHDYPKVQFVEYSVDLSQNLSSQQGVHHRPTAFWHNLARWTGCQRLKNKQWVFVLDADEIPSGHLVHTWFQKAAKHLDKDHCYKMANYWYFKDPKYQATTLEDSVLLIHHKHLTKANIFGDDERDYLIAACQCHLQHSVKGSNDLVLWHHYSWVRSKKAMEHKIKHWAHADDTFKSVNATSIVDKIFADDEVNDVVHKYHYLVVKNFFNIKH